VLGLSSSQVFCLFVTFVHSFADVISKKLKRSVLDAEFQLLGYIECMRCRLLLSMIMESLSLSQMH